MNKKIIWLASYPKCGNTYIRAFLSHYIYDHSDYFSFNNLKKIKRFESKNTFTSVKKFISNNNNYIVYSLEVQRELIKKLPQEQLIFKTHHFFGSINEFEFTNEQNTLLFIYLVRDPREVLISYSKHSGIGIDEMLSILTHDKQINRSGYETLVNWGQNYRSWKSFKSVPSYFIKFEDLVQNPYEIFESIILFLSRYTNIVFDKNKINKIIELISFQNLQKAENKFGFDESHYSKFFRSGKTDSWKKILSLDQIRRVEKKFNKEMVELEYL